MKVTTKKLSDTRVELTVTLGKEELAKATEAAVARLSKQVKVEGFRAGKVPAEVAAKHIDPKELSTVALDIAVRTSVPHAFHEAPEQPLMIPKVEVTKYVPMESAEYTAEADILPEIKLGDYKNLKVKKTKMEVTDKEIEEVLENVRTAYAEKVVAKKKAEMGDEVVIDFEGTKDGVAFDGGAAKDFKLTLGSKQFIPGFEEGCVGHESGDRFDLPLTFPKDYHNKELAGKKANFNILVKQVNEIKKPALDEEFAKKCGPFKNMDELRADIKMNLDRQNEVKADNLFKDELVKALVEKSKVSAPSVMVEDQLRLMQNDVSANLRSQGLTLEEALKQQGKNLDDWKKDASPVAEQRVKASLCLQILARDEKITAEDEIVDAKIAELREVYKKSPEALKNLKDPNVRQDVKNRLTIDKVLNFLVEANGGTAKPEKVAKPVEKKSEKKTEKKSIKKAKK